MKKEPKVSDLQVKKRQPEVLKRPKVKKRCQVTDDVFEAIEKNCNRRTIDLLSSEDDRSQESEDSD